MKKYFSEKEVKEILALAETKGLHSCEEVINVIRKCPDFETSMGALRALPTVKVANV